MVINSQCSHFYIMMENRDCFEGFTAIKKPTLNVGFFMAVNSLKQFRFSIMM